MHIRSSYTKCCNKAYDTHNTMKELSMTVTTTAHELDVTLLSHQNSPSQVETGPGLYLKLE